MSSTTTSSLLCTPPDTVQNIRKYFDLDQPGKMDEAVNILEDWIKMQHHFKEKDFNRNFLELIIIQSKGSLERAKSRLDKYCTLKTMLPKYFEKNNPKTDFEEAHEIFYFGVLPKFVGDYYRVAVLKSLNKKQHTSAKVLDFYRFTLMLLEYMFSVDYFNGGVLVYDFRDVNMGDIIAAVNPVELGECLRLLMDCYGLRVKGFHFLTASALISGLVSLFQQFLSPKLAKRIYVHKDLDSLFKVLPKDMFPEDYGGNEKPLKAIRDDWLEVLASEESLKYIQEMKNATTIEELRDKYEFNSKYMGLPGTFRALSVD